MITKGRNPLGAVWSQHMELPSGNREIDIAVVLPTFNESENVAEVIARLSAALTGLDWELIFVDDDSPDGTARIVSGFAQEDRRIRLIQRIGRRGLSSACIEGILATPATCVAVMDADLQHDERILPRMLQNLRGEGLDIVVATRNSDGGSMSGFSEGRQFLSRLGRRISRFVFRCELTDPMSGFFVVRRSFFLEVVRELHGGGFKILLDILATSRRPVRLGEVGYHFRNRIYGESKLDVSVAVEYLFLVLSKLTGGAIPTRFVVFALVGTIGLIVNLSCLSVLFIKFHLGFSASQAWATLAAMTGNFFLNNQITYRDRRLHGIYMLLGLLSFWLACSFGAWANVSVAGNLLRSGVPWWVAGFAGTVLSAVWNYSISNLFTWQMPQPQRASDDAVAENALPSAKPTAPPGW
jgi:dolichol-phosphate mannosyltransferase